MKKALKTIALALCLFTLLPGLFACSEYLEKEERNSAYDEYDRTGERYDYYLPDYIDVCTYNELEIPDISYVPSEEDIENMMMVKAQYYCTRTQDPDRPCKKGDVVSIITTCTFADTGETYDLLTFKERSEGDGESFVLGCEQFYFPELDDAVIGMIQGQTKKVTLTLPDPFYKDFLNSGRKLDMDITLCWIDDVDYTEATESFYNEHYAMTKEHLREQIIHDLTEDTNELISDYKSEYLWDYITKNSQVIKYPEKELQEIYDSLLQGTRSEALEDELTLLEYVNKTYNCETLDDFYEYLDGISRELCFEDMLFYYIKRCENLTYTDEFHEMTCLEMTEEFEIKDYASSESFLIYVYGENGLEELINEKYVKHWLAENATLRTDINKINSDELN